MRCVKCSSLNTIKKGKIKTRKKSKKVQRFQCKACGHKFTRRSQSETFREKRPELNDRIRSLYIEGMPLRAITRHLNCDYKTTVRKFKKYSYLSQEINLARQYALHKEIQIDELHTFIGCKENKVYVAIAVSGKGKILRFKVSSPENRRQRFSEMLVELRKQVTDDTIFFFDQDHMYKPEFERIFPDNDYYDINKAETMNRDGLLNHVDFACALIRNRLGRASRKSWCFTRHLKRLELNLAMLMENWNRKFI